MAYIGQDLEYGALEKQTLTGNGVLTTFELNYIPRSATGLLVSVGGVIQEPDVAYTISGKNIVFTTAPAAVDIFVVFLNTEYMVSSVESVDYMDYQTGTGTGNTTPLVLTHSISNAEDIFVMLNGIKQTPDTDYTVSGTTLTFTSTVASGVKVMVLYLRLQRQSGVPLDGSVTNPKIVSMDAAKLTGSLPSSMSGDLTSQYQDISTLGLQWANVENKVAFNLTDDFMDVFQDDSGWVAYNGPVAKNSSSTEWNGATSDVTFNGATITFNGTGNRAIRTNDSFTGDVSLEFTATTTSAAMGFGMYEISEDSSFNQTNGRGGMDNMTNSWYWREEGTDRVCYGSNLAIADVEISDGDTVKLERDSGVFKLTVNGTLEHTWAQQSTNPIRICVPNDGPTATSVYTDVVWTTDHTATNTGSENVYRASDEYIASGSETVDNNTVLLIHSDTTNGSTTFVDSSESGHTITPQGNTNHSTTEKKFGASSILFDGATQLQITGSSDFVVSNTDTATIEFWFKLTETTGQYTFIGGDQWTGSERSWMCDAGSNYIRWTNHSNVVSASWTADTDWHHYAVTFDSGTQKVYLDGTQIVTGNVTSQWGSAAGSTMLIGNSGVSAGGYSQAMHGYIDELRWSNVVRYTSNFTPSTTAFTNMVVTTTATGTLLSTTSTADSTVSEATGVMVYKDSEGTNTIGTDLKAYFSADNGSNWTEAASYGNPTTFAGDSKVIPLGKTTVSNTGTQVKMKAEWANQVAGSGTAKTITAVGDAQHSTLYSKIGASSLCFDGTGDYLSIPKHTDFEFTGDFTTECWFYITSHQRGAFFSSTIEDSTSSGIGFLMELNTAGRIDVQCRADVNKVVSSSVQHNLNTWYHAAYVRSGTNVKLYIDGVEQASNTGSTGTVQFPSTIMKIGKSREDTATEFAGYMDEVRISNVARYTSNFTPSTTAFTTDSDTVLLIHSDTTNGSTTFIDSSPIEGKIAQLHGWSVNY